MPFSIPKEKTPEELAASHCVRDQVVLAARETMLQRHLVTISGAMLWGRGFYVLTLRPDIA